MHTSIDEVGNTFQNLCISNTKTFKEAVHNNPKLLQQTDNKKQTLLHYLSRLQSASHHIYIAIAHGASITKQDDLGQTPLHTAICQCASDSVIWQGTLSVLLKAVQNDTILDLMIADLSGNTPFHLAAKHQFSMGSSQLSCIPELAMLLKAYTSSCVYKSRINAPNGLGWTALEIALGYHHTQAIQDLVRAGATIQKRSSIQIDQLVDNEIYQHVRSFTELECLQIQQSLSVATTLDEQIHVLHHIVKTNGITNECREYIWKLLRSVINTLDKADINHASTIDGYTFLHVATLAKDYQSVQTLLAAGAEVNVINLNGISPINMAVLGGNTSIYRLLKTYGAKWAPEQEINPTTPVELSMICYPTSAEIAEDLLLENNVTDIHKLYYTENESGVSACTMLAWAYHLKHLEWILLLLQKGADIESIYSPNK